MSSHILVVEDDELLRALTAESLSSLYALAITPCANADEALVLLTGGLDTALVFTDIHMPGELDGLELAREIWRKWPSVPVILTSGDAIVPIESLPGNAAFLPKPWNFDQLIEQIERLVSLTTRRT
ncbi:response regulator [Pseudomonas sp. NPDC089996]|uniref:response regulator n=1 Tax=Pseudomonas sp. NPDC089996 TaxID=3364474 RepID=UPI003806E941